MTDFFVIGWKIESSVSSMNVVKHQLTRKNEHFSSSLLSANSILK